ncbi:lipopolysaccharide transport periplasmic protein LptA [Persephonella sp.]
MLKALILALFLVSGFTTVYGKEGKTAEKPVVIEADTLEYDKNRQVIVYKGNVVVKKEDFTLWSDLLKIFLNKEGDIEKILAIGNVRFVKGDRKGKSEEAEYFKDKNYIILKGNAQLQQNNNIIEGDEIVYYIDSEKAEVVGKNKRVRTIFFPEEKGKKQ